MPRYNRFRRGRRFGGPRVKTAVTESNIPMPKTKSRRKCAACSQHLTVGEPVTRLRLKKSFQHPCSSCGHKPAKLKYFHAACKPSDINKAMGYDPAQHGTIPTGAGGAVPPPPKPMTIEERQLAALVAIEQVVGARAASDPRWKKEAAALLNTYQGCKARALRGSTDGEMNVGMKMALKKAIDLVF